MPKSKFHFRLFLRAAPICLVVGLLLPAAFTAPLADSATGTGTVLGNAANRAPDPSLPQDPDWATAKHTPTGQLFKIPFAVPKLEDVKKIGSEWEYSGQLEVGFIKGDADECNVGRFVVDRRHRQSQRRELHGLP